MLFAVFTDPSRKTTLFVEDDDRVAYAYLSQQGEVVADVWLYNRVEAPVEPEWDFRKPGDQPYLNPRKYVQESLPYRLPEDPEQLAAEWLTSAQGNPGARIFADGRLIAELFCGDKPGKSLAAAEAGPLALPI